MGAQAAKVLIVDDEQSLLELLEIVLDRAGYTVITAADAEEGWARFGGDTPDLVLLDLRLGQDSGLELLQRFKAADPLVPVVVITAYSTWDNAVQAMQLGAYDFLKKPFDDNEVVREVVARALAQRATLPRAERRDAASEILGNSPAMRHVLDLVNRVAPTDSTVLVTGESGTGKEVLARALHYCSLRAGGPFLSVNCAAFPETLLESELFGHMKGAFSGAVTDKVGLIQTCDGGTLFLDEIGEMNLDLQAKLLRVLEERRILPVGGTSPRKVDVRFVCATNRDLEAAVAEGRFRADLYFRVNVLAIELPPLRERKKDIPLLAAHFLTKYARKQGRTLRGFTTEVQERLEAHHWPGNVRELENVIQRCVTLCRGDILTEDPLAGHRSLPATAARPGRSSLEVQLGEEGIDLEGELARIERLYVEAALQRTGGHLTNAAKLLGITFRSIRYKVKKHGLER